MLTTDGFHSVPFSMKIPRFSPVFKALVISVFINMGDPIFIYYTIFFSLRENKTNQNLKTLAQGTHKHSFRKFIARCSSRALSGASKAGSKHSTHSVWLARKLGQGKPQLPSVRAESRELITASRLSPSHPYWGQRQPHHKPMGMPSCGGLFSTRLTRYPPPAADDSTSCLVIDN